MRQATIVIQEVKKLTREYTADDSGEMVPIMAFECRNLEPIRWHPRDGFDGARPRGRGAAGLQLGPEGWRALVMGKGNRAVGGAAAVLPPGGREAARSARRAVVSASGKKVFEGADLSDEWTEYDDDANEAMSIMNLKHEWRTHRET